MSQKRFVVGVTTAIVSGLLGAVYGWNVAIQLGGVIVWFAYGASLGFVCGSLSKVIGHNLMRLWSGRKPPLGMNLILGALVGLIVGLVIGRDLILCAMAGEVGALLMSDHSAELGHI